MHKYAKIGKHHWNPPNPNIHHPKMCFWLRPCLRRGLWVVQPDVSISIEPVRVRAKLSHHILQTFALYTL